MHRFLSRADLRAEGLSGREITRAVRGGELIRARRDHYLPSATPDLIVRAVRVGGRLTCLSLLVLLGVFVLSNDKLHVHVAVTASRLRSPHDRRSRLESRRKRGVRLHWRALAEVPGDSACVSVIDALAHSIQCQAPRAAVATLDSALHLGILAVADLGEVFDSLPARYRVISGLTDARAESGPETLVRLMVRGLGGVAVPQVEFDEIGRVDLLVDGWLVIECDSEEFHSGWVSQESDRRRDAMLAALGYTTLRLTAAVIMYEPELALSAIRGLLAARA